MKNQLATDATMVEINTVAARRARNFATKRDPAVSLRCTEILSELWSRFRTERAQHLYGDRVTIAARARIERELDRLCNE